MFCYFASLLFCLTRQLNLFLLQGDNYQVTVYILIDDFIILVFSKSSFLRVLSTLVTIMLVLDFSGSCFHSYLLEVFASDNFPFLYHFIGLHSAHPLLRGEYSLYYSLPECDSQCMVDYTSLHLTVCTSSTLDMPCVVSTSHDLTTFNMYSIIHCTACVVNCSLLSSRLSYSSLIKILVIFHHGVPLRTVCCIVVWRGSSFLSFTLFSLAHC